MILTTPSGLSIISHFYGTLKRYLKEHIQADKKSLRVADLLWFQSTS
ncbi:hypothetical protein B194_4550 [Serratia plymuthica A30]|nr:hypothetical protein B194_4550 [Serratia plymuthica A30]